MAGFFCGSELQMVKPDSLIAKCGACGLFKGCKSPKMAVSGRGAKKILIVGEFPELAEDCAGRHFVGEDGNFLKSALAKLGVDLRNDCWLTNAVICRPKNDRVTSDSVEYCRPNLIESVSKLNPNVVILLGQHALKSLVSHLWSSNVGSIVRWTGWQIPAQKINAWVCPTYPPSHVLSKDNCVVSGYFADHLKAAVKLADRKPWDEVPDYTKQIRLVYSPSEAADYIGEITTGAIAFDYECNMLKPESKQREIVSCSICWNGKDTFAFPMEGAAVPALKQLLSNGAVLKVASNMKYEDRWSRRVLGVKVAGWYWDTMLAAHLLDCRRGITGLKFQSFVQLGVPRYDSGVEEYLKSNDLGGNAVNRVTSIPLQKLLTYNAMDSLLEYQLAKKQMALMGLKCKL